MKRKPFKFRAPAYDADAIQATIQGALAAAGLDTQAGPMQQVLGTIRRALAGGLAAQTAAGSPGRRSTQDADSDRVIEVAARLVPPDPASPAAGSFDTHQFSSAAGSRSYKVYLPRAARQADAAAPAPRAMLVMLHGCTQSADDFAAGTRMNQLADAQDLIVVYPEQVATANPSKCWNWFDPQHQRRDAGEPALIAGIVRELVQAHGIDPGRVFVAGLSAGAAMAVVLGETYPDLFAGVGAHSGLPYGSAHDIPSALAAMKGAGRGGSGRLRGPHRPAGAGAPQRRAQQAIPVIVFHGDRDPTVQPGNGAQIVQQARDAHDARAGAAQLQLSSTHAGVTPGGRRFSRTVHADAQGRAWIESWIVQGAGHAWSGGHAGGSYTDPGGPDASAEMLRFFMALAPAPPQTAEAGDPQP